MATGKRSIWICLLLAAVILLSGCEPQSGLQYKKYGPAALKNVGLVLGSPGKSDPATNDAVAAGIKNAVGDMDIEYKILAPKELVNDQESLAYLADNNYDMVVAIGSGMMDDLAVVAPQYPDIKFVMFDGEVNEPNVTSVKIQEDDGAFLAGVEAAVLTKTNLVGYIGDPVSTQTSIENGFIRGVQYVNMTEGKRVKVQVSYTGVTDKAAKVAELAKSLADSFYFSGVDVIFSADSNINRGVANSAIQNKRISLCDDVQLMNTEPWNIYGAVTKKEDAVIYNLIKQMVDGKLAAGRQGFGLAQGAVDFIPSQAVPVDIISKITAVKAQLKSGGVKPYTIDIPQDTVIRVKSTPPAETGTNTGNTGNPPTGGTQSGGQKQGWGKTNQPGVVIRKVQKPAAGGQTTDNTNTGANTGTSGSSPTGSSPTGSSPTGSSPTGGNQTGSNPTGSSDAGGATGTAR